MSFSDEWEDFYVYVDDENVDYIMVNTKKKKYVLYRNVSDMITDSVNDDGEFTNCLPVSREIFEIIVEGVKERKFTQLKEVVE
ncbi:MAG: hypothetical protein IJA23_02945 [Clostridia bacterium]|nr:hypothetical protein [Clostridia bacterium]